MSTSKRFRNEEAFLHLGNDGEDASKRLCFLTGKSWGRLARMSCESDLSCFDCDCEVAGRAVLCSECGAREQARFSQVLLRNDQVSPSPLARNAAEQPTSSSSSEAGSRPKGFEEQEVVANTPCDCKTAGQAALCSRCSAVELARFRSLVRTSSSRPSSASHRAVGISDFLLT
jgi:hypothetical protein